MDVFGRILANLDAGNPCRHDDDLHFHVLRGERKLMTHFVVNEIKMIMPRCPQGSLKELKLKSSVMRDFSHTEMIRFCGWEEWVIGVREYWSIGY